MAQTTQRNSHSADSGHRANPLAAPPEECGIDFWNSLNCLCQMCLGSVMETSWRESAAKVTGTSISQSRRRNSSGFRAGWAVLACSAALVLSSCTAGQAESADEGSADSSTSPTAAPLTSPTAAPTTPPPPAPSPTVAALTLSELIEPAAPRWNFPLGERLLLSEKGTAAGNHPLQGPVEPGEVLSILASCSPGSVATVRLNNSVGGGELACNNPTGNRITTAYAAEAVGEMTVTVETADAGPYWVVAWAHAPLE